MNFKTTYVLFGVLVALLAIASFSLLTGPPPGTEGLLLANWKASDVTAKDVTKVVIERASPAAAKQVFVRADKDRWKLEEPYPAAVDSSAVDRLIGDLLNAKKETKGADLAGPMSKFGLDQPAMTVTLTAGERAATVTLGSVAAGSGSFGGHIVYVTSSDDPRTAAAVRSSDLSGLLKDADKAKSAGDAFKTVSDYRPRDLILDRTFNPAEDVRTVKIKGEKDEVALSRTSAGTWQYDTPKGFGVADVEGDPAGAGNEPAAPTGVKPLFAAIQALRVGGGDDFIENVTDFQQYGLEPGKEAMTIAVTRKNPAGGDAADIAETLALGKKEGEKVFARVGTESAVAKVPASAVEPLKKLLEKPGALRDRNLVSANVSAADGIDVQIGGDPPLEFRKSDNRWKLYDKDGKAVDASATEVTALLNAIGGKHNVKEFPDEKQTDAALGFDRPSAVVTAWIGGIVPEEKKPEEKKDDKKPEEKAKTEGKAKADDKGKAAEPKKDEKKPEEKKEPAKPKMKEPTVKLVFGKRDKDLLYVQRQAGSTKTNLAVDPSMLAKVTHGRLDYVDTILPSFVANDATKLSFNRGGETYTLEKKKPDDKSPEQWTITSPPSLAGRAADNFQVTRLLGDLAGEKAEKLWAEKATETELDRWALKSPKLKATVTVKKDGKDEERVYLFGGDAEGGVYAKQGERDLVFSARKSIVDDFASLDILDPTVIRIDPNKVTGMKLTGWKDVAGEEQTLDMERKGTNNWAMKGDSKFKLSTAAAEGFLSLVANVRAEKFVSYKTGPKPEQKLTPANDGLAVELTVDGEKQPVTLVLGAEAEGKYYYATSNKAPGDVFLVAKDRFEKYKAKRAAFSAD